MNPYLLGLLPVGLAYGAWAWWRRRPGGGVGLLALCWLAANYLPFYPATIVGQRIAYIYYFLPCLPAVALAGSSLLLSTRLPRLITWAYLATVLLAFYGYFPFRSFG